MTAKSSSADKVRRHRENKRREGMRLVQFWVPDTRTEAFKREARRQARLINEHPGTAEDQAFIDAISAPLEDE